MRNALPASLLCFLPAAALAAVPALKAFPTAEGFGAGAVGGRGGRVLEVTTLTVDGLEPRAVFVPGHSYDSVIYLTELAGKRVAFTGDLGFKCQDILHRCWGDVDKAAAVTEVVRTKVLSFRPHVVFTGHYAHEDGMAFLEELVAQSEASIRTARDGGGRSK
jgi:glyoxylase-like metal-dependent hydrolase (beta-lactamase superfamily II)